MTDILQRQSNQTKLSIPVIKFEKTKKSSFWSKSAGCCDYLNCFGCFLPGRILPSSFYLWPCSSPVLPLAPAHLHWTWPHLFSLCPESCTCIIFSFAVKFLEAGGHAHWTCLLRAVRCSVLFRSSVRSALPPLRLTLVKSSLPSSWRGCFGSISACLLQASRWTLVRVIGLSPLMRNGLCLTHCPVLAGGAYRSATEQPNTDNWIKLLLEAEATAKRLWHSLILTLRSNYYDIFKICPVSG